ncbi:MAG: protease modulator HflC [Phycisphaerae bacterium]|nr:protease modulator HflC [Phycisphaerae bacterium]
MRHLGVPILILILVVVFLSMLVVFQVRQTEVAFVTRFGRPVRPVMEPGLHVKWPDPIESVTRFDSRMRLFEGDFAETTTRGAVPVIVKTYVIWRVADPLEFYKSVGTSIAGAENKLYSHVKDTQNRVFGQHHFGELVNSDPNQVRLAQIEDEMLADFKRSVEKEYGIEVPALGIKQLKVSEDVTAKVFDRMKAARTLRTRATIAEGQAEAKAIESDAKAKKEELLAAANARAMAIRGQGDAEAARYYQMLEQEPQFALFLKNLEALKTMFTKGTTFVVPMDVEPFKLLKDLPDPNSWRR